MNRFDEVMESLRNTNDEEMDWSTNDNEKEDIPKSSNTLQGDKSQKKPSHNAMKKNRHLL